MTKPKHLSLLLSLWASVAIAQQTVSLNDLSAFKNPTPNWSVAGTASADINQANNLNTQTGSGILVCKHEIGKYGTELDLLTGMQHGDLDLDIDFMMAKGSNSGIYLQSRYEVQLYDSWGKKTPKYNDCGGIYERWNDSKPDGQKGYEGVAPRVNVCKAPGLWQNIKISFQAPRFDANGKKTSNAKFLSVILNGVLIHENVEVTGVTRGVLSDESAMAPLRIQGDHGSVAFRNIKYKSFNQKSLSFSDLKFGVYKGNFRTIEDIEKIKPETEGNAAYLNWSVSNEENNFGVKYAGKINVPEAGKYTFTTVHGGNTQMKINGQELFKNGWLWSGSDGRKATVELPAGNVPFELYYWKTDGWLQPSLGLYAESETIRKQPLHVASSSLVASPIPQITLAANEPTILRSFMDIQENDKAKRIVHAVSVGSNESLHYTYDLDNASVFQVWRGGFLNTAFMWYDRGDGSAKPLGGLLSLSDDPAILQLSTPETAWGKADASYRPRGYELDEEGQPTFLFDLYGTSISDKTTPNTDGKYLTRTIVPKSLLPNTYVRLAVNKTIIKNTDGSFTVGDGNYYIKLNEGSASIRTSNGNQELIAPLGSKLSYSIIW